MYLLNASKFKAGSSSKYSKADLDVLYASWNAHCIASSGFINLLERRKAGKAWNEGPTVSKLCQISAYVSY